MKTFVEQKFNIGQGGQLKGISAKNIEEHLKLYAGYVKNANLILEKIAEYKQDAEKNAYVLGELQRRFGFEFNGMRNHEYYFRSLEGGLTPVPIGGKLATAAMDTWLSYQTWLEEFKAIALTRGIGWAMLYYDPQTKRLLNAWVDEQHLGQLATCNIILALDMWEHAYVYDYPTSEKKKYVEAFFENLNWSVVEENFQKATK